MDDPIDITEQSPFRVGEWHVDPDSGRIQRQDEEVKLEPKVMSVLVYLAQNAGKVVSRESLEATVWKDIVVGYDAVSGSIIKLRKALGDDSRNPRYIETVSKKGYRLIAAVTQDSAIELDSELSPAEKSVNLTQHLSLEFPHKKRKPVSGQLIGSIAALVVIIMFWNALELTPKSPVSSSDDSADTKGQPTARQPSIVVLPFKNLSDDPQQEYFSDGITDDIITDLSQVGALRVVARQSAYHYKNTTIGLDEVGKDLNVQYIVEGSVQKAGQRIRINIQLTDVANGHHLWAERFDRDLDDVFAIQDEIAKRIIDAMFVTLSDQENQRVLYRTTNNFAAYDTLLLGLQHSKNRTRQGHDLAMEAYQRAIALDPDYARAYGAMAVALTRGYRFQWTDLPIQEARERAMQLANKAVALDQSTPQIYWSLGFVHLFRKEYQEAEAAAMQSVTLSPNYADGYGILAFIANWRGKAEEAERYIKKAIALNPYHTFDYPWNLGLAYYTMGRHEEAIAALQNALERNESVLMPRLFLAASLVRLNRLEDAQWETEQISILRPDTTISHLANTLPYEHQEQMNALLDDLRQAGLPE